MEGKIQKGLKKRKGGSGGVEISNSKRVSLVEKRKIKVYALNLDISKLRDIRNHIPNNVIKP